MSDKNIEKYDGEKDLNLDAEVTVLPETDWVSVLLLSLPRQRMLMGRA